MSARSPEELINRHETFLACQPVEHPLIGVWVGGYYPREQFPRGTSRWHEGQRLRPEDVRLAHFALDYEHLYEIHRAVEDDFFYVGSAYWGIPWLEAILGCAVVAGKDSCWVEPCLTNLDAADNLRVELDENEWFLCLEQFTKDLVDLSDGRFPVCAPLLRGPGDAASAMLGAMTFVTGFLDAPDRMRNLLEHCAQVRLAVVRRLRAAIPEWHGTYAAGGYPSKVWSRKTVAYNQEDSAALLSPDLFREFLLPLERQMCQAADVNFIHLHSGCLYPVDVFLERPCYDVLEVNVDHGGSAPRVENLLGTFRKVQKAGRPLLLWGYFSPVDWELVLKELSPAGLSLQPLARTLDEARLYAIK